MSAKVSPEDEQIRSAEITDREKRNAVINGWMYTVLPGPKLSDGPTKLSDQFSGPIALYVIRNPAIPEVRLVAKSIVQLFETKFPHIELVGVMGNPNMSLNNLTLETFRKKFFHNRPIYFDCRNHFYDYFGRLNMTPNQPTMNPLTAYRQYTDKKRRAIVEKRLEAGISYKTDDLKGGLLLIVPDIGVIYNIEQSAGQKTLPLREIEFAVKCMVKSYSNPLLEKENETQKTDASADSP